MLLPTVFESHRGGLSPPEDEHVQVWDVACERQVQVKGPDARRLIQYLTPRDLSGLHDARLQCFYVPIVDETGGMLNDPVMLDETLGRSLVDFDCRQ